MAKGKLPLKSLFLESRYLQGSPLLAFANTCDILSLLLEGRYFQEVVTFGTLQ